MDQEMDFEQERKQLYQRCRTCRGTLVIQQEVMAFLQLCSEAMMQKQKRQLAGAEASLDVYDKYTLI